MQEEIEQKSFNLMISTTKLSARTVLRAAELPGKVRHKEQERGL